MKQNFYNINIDISNRQAVLDQCLSFFNSGTNHTIFFLNAHCFNVAKKNADYHREINRSDLLLNDGIGIKIASMFNGVRFRENLNGTDLIPEILALAAEQRQPVFLLGGKEGVAERASVRIRQRLPEINIAGYASGYFTEDENEEIISRINDSGASVLIIGMGVPRQELWAARNRNFLKNVRIIIAGGAIIDFISGSIKRAPLWMRKMNLEWLYRFYLEPGRMWRRYLLGNILFFYYIFTTRPITKEQKKIS